MNPQTSQIFFGEEPAFTRRYRTIGLIASLDAQERLNLFRLYISSTTKRALKEFVDYQKERNGIQVSVEHLTGPRPKDYAKPLSPPKPPTLKDIQQFGRPQEQGVEINFGGGKINVGISRWYIATPKPYKVQYDIDPQVFNITITRNSTHTYQFSGNNAFVDCKVEKADNSSELIGNIDVSLKEKNWGAGWIVRRESREISTTSGGQALFSSVVSEFTGEWKVEIIGKAPLNQYRINYQRIIF